MRRRHGPACPPPTPGNALPVQKPVPKKMYLQLPEKASLFLPKSGDPLLRLRRHGGELVRPTERPVPGMDWIDERT
jgi:hypothetical protein